MVIFLNRIHDLINRILITGTVISCLAYGVETVIVSLELKDGNFSSNYITVPAGKRIKLILKNTGDTPAEFESWQLHKEKVLAPGVTSYLIVSPLRPGRYIFFDDFHQAGQGIIIAK